MPEVRLSAFLSPAIPFIITTALAFLEARCQHAPVPGSGVNVETHTMLSLTVGSVGSFFCLRARRARSVLRS